MSSKRSYQQEKQDEACSSEEPCSSSSIPAQAQKRARYSDSAEQQVPGEQRPEEQQQHPAGTAQDLTGASSTQVSRFRHSQQVQRPGIPNPIRLSAFKLADKPSPPLRGDDKVRKGTPGGTWSAYARAFLRAAADTPADVCRRATTTMSWAKTSAHDVSKPDISSCWPALPLVLLLACCSV